MDYISETLTQDQLYEWVFQSSKSQDSLSSIKAALSNFDHFCQSEYSKSKNEVLRDLQAEYQNNRDTRKPLIILNNFKTWLGQDHDDIKLSVGKNAKRKKKISSANTKKSYLNQVKKWLRLCGNIRIDNDDFKNLVAVKSAESDDEIEAEPFTKEELKEIISNVSDPIRRGKFLFMKCTAARHLESLRIKKRDIDFSVNPPKVNFKKSIVKGKYRSRIAYLDSEARSFIYNLCKNISDDDYIFRKSDEQNLRDIDIRSSESRYWRQLIIKISQTNSNFDYLDKRDNNNRLIKRIHSIRSFAMRAIEMGNNSGELADVYGGHKKFVGKYLDKTDDQIVQIFKKGEPFMLVFSEIVTVDNQELKDEYNQRIAALEADNQNLKSLLKYIIDSNGIDFKIKNKIE